MSLRVGVLGATGTWHTRTLTETLGARGHEVVAVPATRLVAEVDLGLHVRGPGGELLDNLDLLFVRGLPRGSLEQVIYRVNALHTLADLGVRTVNSARAIERSIDKSWASSLLAQAGLPTPATVVCEHYEAAMQAFDRLGGDVVVKPLFGAMGNGIVRVEDRDLAHRVFRALDPGRAVYYLQRTVAPPGRRDVRVLVVAGEIAGAMERSSDSWRANVARGAKPRAVQLTDAQRDLAVAAAAALEVDVAGIDLLLDPDGQDFVVEVNGIPGWQALQSVCEEDLTVRVISACEALLTV
ncbi:MAG: RimK family alpha-L-glutamate ligase [Solirubrobacterales bacterium]|nr:RimK family alpha-L-glutamate ligase [Solirubrobacterales bacterium]